MTTILWTSGIYTLGHNVSIDFPNPNISPPKLSADRTSPNTPTHRIHKISNKQIPSVLTGISLLPGIYCYVSSLAIVIFTFVQQTVQLLAGLQIVGVCIGAFEEFLQLHFTRIRNRVGLPWLIVAAAKDPVYHTEERVTDNVADRRTDRNGARRFGDIAKARARRFSSGRRVFLWRLGRRWWWWWWCDFLWWWWRRRLRLARRGWRGSWGLRFAGR